MALQGVDVSSWQKGIDLARVPCDFAVIKATQGCGYTSPCCDEQYRSATGAGKLVGVYHYVDGSSVSGEASHFVQSIKGYIGHALLAIDWESGSNSAWGNEGYLEEMTRRVISFTGIRPLIYASASRYGQVKAIADRLNCGLWVAQYANNKPTGYQTSPWNEGKYACAMRQYSSAGRLDGYAGNLDLNKFYGTRDQWLAYAGSEDDKVTDADIDKIADRVWAHMIHGWNGDVRACDRLAGADHAANMEFNVSDPTGRNVNLNTHDHVKYIGAKLSDMEQALSELSDKVDALAGEEK